MTFDNRQKALDYLLKIADDHGYVIVDEIIDATDTWDLSICDVDWLSSTIASYGILIYEKAPNALVSETVDYNDYAQSDYEELFANVLSLEPALRPLIDELRQIRPAQYKELSKIITQVKEGNEYARNRLIEVHLRAAVRVAYQRAIQFDTDINECLGNSIIGLLIAVKKYDPDRNGPFGSYATMWMIQSMSREQATSCPDIYYPVHKREPFFIAYPHIKEYGCTECDLMLTCNKVKRIIIEKLECDSDQAGEIINQSTPWLSLDELYENVDALDNRFIDNGYYQEDADSTAIYNEFYFLLEKALSKLSQKEEYVLRSRWGINLDEPKTLESIAVELGVTRERIRQIEGKAKNKLLKTPELNRLLGLYD